MFTFTPHFMLGFSLTLSNCAIHAFVFLYFLFPAPLSCLENILLFHFVTIAFSPPYIKILGRLWENGEGGRGKGGGCGRGRGGEKRGGGARPAPDPRLLLLFHALCHPHGDIALPFILHAFLFPSPKPLSPCLFICLFVSRYIFLHCFFLSLSHCLVRASLTVYLPIYLCVYLCIHVYLSVFFLPPIFFYSLTVC